MPLMFAMSLVVISELSVQEDRMSEFLELVGAGLEVSRNFEGNQSFDIVVEEGSDKVVFVERWETQEDFEKYYQWRMEQGDFEELRTYFSAPPNMRRFTSAY